MIEREAGRPMAPVDRAEFCRRLLAEHCYEACGVVLDQLVTEVGYLQHEVDRQRLMFRGGGRALR